LVTIESVYATPSLAINSNFGRISYCFRDIDAYTNSLFSPPHSCLAEERHPIST